jgi:hypothetical protein
MHDLTLHLVRLPEKQDNLNSVDKAPQRLIKEFTIIEEQLVKTQFIAAELWAMGDIPILIRCCR